MLGLKPRDEFLGEHMPGTAISLRTSDHQGAAQRSPDYILSITYPTADVQTALKAISAKKTGRPIVLMGDRGRGKSHIMAVMHHGIQAPESAEPASRLFLRLFKNGHEMERDELHKTLRGTGISQGDLEAKGWIRVVGRAVHVVPVHERFAYFTERGRNRKVIKTDLDQAHFLIGAAYPDSGLKIESELNNPNFRVKKSVDDILKWSAEMDKNATNRMAARTAAQLVDHWRTRKTQPDEQQQLSLFETLDME